MDSDYDIIFAGGGTTACVTAGRLATADPSLKILILEAGSHTKDVPRHVQPGRFLKNLGPGSDTFTYNFGQPSDALNGRRPVIPSGRAVGGGSSVNFMVYSRASASDYDSWEKVHGNKGWGSDKLIPLLKKAETYQGEITNDTHGTNGPIKVSVAKEYTNIASSFLEVSAACDKERSVTNDIDDFSSSDQYGKWVRFIDIETGRRSDTAHGYIYNQRNDVKLTVLDKSRVIRVIVENGRATGVEFINENDKTGSRIVVKASRLVVISAGAISSPNILERSGIGSKNVLDKNGIAQIVDLPGVGEHYMDHLFSSNFYYGSDETESLDGVLRGNEADAQESKWSKEGTGLLAQNGFAAVGKLRPTAEERRTISPEFDQHWETLFAKYPDKPAIVAFIAACYPGDDLPVGKYFGTTIIMAYPLSTGHVHITGGLDPHGPIDFHPGYMDELADVATVRWGYKKLRETIRRMKLYRGEILSSHPTFPRGSAAETRNSATPVDINAPDIVYSKEDDEAIDKFNREISASGGHSCGTCAMKPRNQGGVVDERLNVYDITNLKVADLSVIPENVGSPTYSTAIAVGEKAAVIIAQDLKIEGVSEF